MEAADCRAEAPTTLDCGRLQGGGCPLRSSPPCPWVDLPGRKLPAAGAGQLRCCRRPCQAKVGPCRESGPRPCQAVKAAKRRRSIRASGRKGGRFLRTALCRDRLGVDVGVGGWRVGIQGRNSERGAAVGAAALVREAADPLLGTDRCAVAETGGRLAAAVGGSGSEADTLHVTCELAVRDVPRDSTVENRKATLGGVIRWDVKENFQREEP